LGRSILHRRAYAGVSSKSLKSNVLQADPCVSVHASILQSEDVRAVSFARVVTTS
jgi:hypothetical protein